MAIFIRVTARVFSAPDSVVSGSWPASAANLFGAVINGKPERAASSAAMASPKPWGEFSPVPTAVPPWASSQTAGSALRMARSA
ncbi:hypothetical protein D3C75_1003900 [compost metagenome]